MKLEYQKYLRPFELFFMFVLSESYVQSLEQKAIVEVTLNLPPKKYRRYVDDSHVRFKF